jgi:hypothetical protein
MIRKQVYIDEAQEEFLKQQTKQLGVTEAELIRRGIDMLRSNGPARRAPFDPEAWQHLMAFFAERARLPSTETGRTWTREDAYEERLAKFSR